MIFKYFKRKNIVSKRAQKDKLLLSIVETNKKANKLMKSNKNTINATVGMILKDKKIFTFRSVSKVLKNLTNEERFKYQQPQGGDSFQSNIKKFIFKEEYENICKNNDIYALSTPGGSGAINLALHTLLDEKMNVIIPRITWNPYKHFIKESNLKELTYEPIKNNILNFEGIEKIIKKAKKYSKTVTMILNDPCSNPIGYTMTNDEYIKLVKIINKQITKGYNFNLILDLAYIDFSDRDRSFFNELNKLKNTTVFICVSLSKSLAIYGLRLGAAIIMKKNTELINAVNYSALCRFSNPNSIAINTFNNLMNNEYDNYLKELEQVKLEIKEKSLIFNDIKKLPYHEGFYITIKDIDYNLLQQNNIFAVKVNEFIRICIASLTIEECKMIKNIIKEAN